MIGLEIAELNMTGDGGFSVESEDGGMSGWRHVTKEDRVLTEVLRTDMLENVGEVIPSI